MTFQVEHFFNGAKVARPFIRVAKAVEAEQRQERIALKRALVRATANQRTRFRKELQKIFRGLPASTLNRRFSRPHINQVREVRGTFQLDLIIFTYRGFGVEYIKGGRLTKRQGFKSPRVNYPKGFNFTRRHAHLRKKPVFQRTTAHRTPIERLTFSFASDAEDVIQDATINDASFYRNFQKHYASAQKLGRRVGDFIQFPDATF